MNAQLSSPGTGPLDRSPFDIDDGETYAGWRDWKLGCHPASPAELAVEVADPFNLTESEHAALLDRIRRANTALYVSDPVDADTGKDLIRAVGSQFGLNQLDANMLADDDGVTPLTVMEDGRRPRYIPYTNRPISWHTDGYYNTMDRQDRSLLLYCVQDAAEGGENAVLDHEIAYILLREENPDFIRALMHPHAMTIPANVEENVEIRSARTGPVFSVDPLDGTLHMRYTARKRNIEWRDDSVTHDAVAFIERLTNGDSPYLFRHRMTPGQGLVSTNVLHDRSGFNDSPEMGIKRLLYRARYFDRIAGTTIGEVWPG